MSTNDVPGAVAANRDVLAMGCWAESENGDGSYILVQGFENGRVVYEVFDTSKTPPIAYRDAMPEATFKRQFSWDGKKDKNQRWRWHDKNAFPWEVIIQKGVQSGSRHAMATDVLAEADNIRDTMDRLGDDDGHGAAARRVARELHLRGRALDPSEAGRVRRVLSRLRDGIQNAIDELTI